MIVRLIAPPPSNTCPDTTREHGRNRCSSADCTIAYATIRIIRSRSTFTISASAHRPIGRPTRRQQRKRRNPPRWPTTRTVFAAAVSQKQAFVALFSAAAAAAAMKSRFRRTYPFGINFQRADGKTRDRALFWERQIRAAHALLSIGQPYVLKSPIYHVLVRLYACRIGVTARRSLLQPLTFSRGVFDTSLL